MKKTTYIIAAIAIAGAATFSSCSDLMDIKPSTEYVEADVFTNPSLAQAYVNNLYNGIQHGAQEHTSDGLTDDSYFTHNYGQKAINEATVNESNLQWYNNNNNTFHWRNRYKALRDCNTILTNIDMVPEDPQYNKDHMKGQAYFIRAWIFTELMRGFGGIPLVTEQYEMNQIEEMQTPRNTIDEVIAQIISDCDAAAALLPDKFEGKDLGRAGKYAAIALKARACLHVASPLYADRTVNTLACNQFSGDRKAMYQKAKDAADEVINSGQYALLDCTGGLSTERAVKWNAVMATKNSEQILIRQFKLGSGAQNNVNKQHGPNGYSNWAGMTPTHDLVMSFELEDGTFYEGMQNIGDYSTINPYNGREPRFYTTIATDGNEYGRPRPSNAAPLDPTPLGRLQAGAYELTTGGQEIRIDLPNGKTETFNGIWGIDTRQGPIEDWNGSWTGYYEKKLIDPTIDAKNFPQEVPFTFLRLAEMYLIAAEASIENGDINAAVPYLDAVRGRIGILPTKDALTAQGKSFDQASMREFIRHERRVEFAYESFRYFDIRRWMIAPTSMNKQIGGILVYGRLKAGQTQERPYIHNEDKYTYHYWVKHVKQENRRWEDKMYFAPIARDEINRNPKLEQNPGMK